MRVKSARLPSHRRRASTGGIAVDPTVEQAETQIKQGKIDEARKTAQSDDEGFVHRLIIPV